MHPDRSVSALPYRRIRFDTFGGRAHLTRNRGKSNPQSHSSSSRRLWEWGENGAYIALW